MTSTSFLAPWHRWIALACSLAIAAPGPAHAQLSSLKQAVEAATPAAPAAGETPEQNQQRLEQWVRNAREALTRMDAAGATAALPEGISPADFENRRRDLEQMVLTGMRSLKNLQLLTDAQQQLQAAKAEDAAWTGFKDKPPYPLPFIDGLVNERDTVCDQISSLESSLTNSDSLLASTVAETKLAEERVSEVMLELQGASGPAAEAAKWRLDAARGRSRLLAERSGFLENRCTALKDQLAATTIRLGLLDRQIKTARLHPRFNDDDLAAVTKACEARKDAIQKELGAATKRLKSAIAARTQAQAAVDALLAETTTNVDAAAVELAKLRLKVTDDRADASQAVVEGLEYLIQLENLGLTANQNRHAIVNAANPEKLTAARQSLSNLRERLWAWENVADDEIASCSALIAQFEQPASQSATASDAQLKLLQEQKAAISDKLAMLQRLAKAVAYQRKLVKRWDIEYSPPQTATGFVHNLNAFGNSAWGAVKKLWSFEIMTFEDKVEVEGRTLVARIPVTLGLLLRALLFFLIGYWIISGVVGRLEATVVKRGHIAQAQARTLRNWAMIAIGILLAIATLSVLKIPLTVFAFFGGALAIGLGFGTQTLIKNFISGIIVLAERKVRVGDILDVDGIVGTVTEINTRSSVIRSPDDVETMIPNSLFLENRVTNWTLSSHKMRRSISLGVAYGSPPARVMEILTDSASRHGLICKDPPPFAVFDDFGDNSLRFSLYYWLELRGTTNGIVVASDLRLMIEKRLLEAGINVPFPQRDLHLTTSSPLQIELAAPPSN